MKQLFFIFQGLLIQSGCSKRVGNQVLYDACNKQDLQEELQKLNKQNVSETTNIKCHTPKKPENSPNLRCQLACVPGYSMESEDNKSDSESLLDEYGLLSLRCEKTGKHAVWKNTKTRECPFANNNSDLPACKPMSPMACPKGVSLRINKGSRRKDTLKWYGDDTDLANKNKLLRFKMTSKFINKTLDKQFLNIRKALGRHERTITLTRLAEFNRMSRRVIL